MQPNLSGPPNTVGAVSMYRSDPVDGFRLAYDRSGSGAAVLLLHGWPGDRTDFREVVALLGVGLDVVVPDLRGFGDSDKHLVEPREQYSATAQAHSIAGLIDELGLDRPVVAGYDIGSRIAQALARERPDLVSALVVSPPLPGIGPRVLGARPQAEFWYQTFHQLALAEVLLDGKPDVVREYLRHFWTHWSGPHFELADEHLAHLVAAYSAPGRSSHRSAGTAPARVRSPGRLPSRLRRPRTGRRRPPLSCGPSTTRCSRGSGPTGWTSSSAPSTCASSTGSGISRRWSARRNSPRQS